MRCAPSWGMIARKLEDLLVYRKALDTAVAVSEILKRPAICKDFELKDQLSRSSHRVAPLIAEGFGQLTDRHVAVYLGRARGSVLETLAHLTTALERNFILQSEFSTFADQYDHIGKMLTRWINYLQRCDWKQRG